MNNAGALNCFNFLRLIAAYVVVTGHMYLVTGRSEPLFGSFTLSGTGIAIFFSISGYLATQSWLADPHLGRFAARRALRVFPALTAVILISTFALGPLATKMPEARYFSSEGTWAYLNNIVLDTTYSLPGVFETAPMKGIVNASLWTVPLGILMYMSLALIGRLHGTRSPLILLAAVIALCIISTLYGLYTPRSAYFGTMELHQILTLAPYFWIASLFYVFRRHIEFTIARSLVVFAISIMLAPTSCFTVWSWIAVPYLTISFASGTDRMFRIPWQMGDLSYGIYLWSFPVQQVLWHTYHTKLPWLQILALSAMCATMFALISWEAVEYPALRFKRRIKARATLDNTRHFTFTKDKRS